MTDIYQNNTYRNGMDAGNYQSVFRKKTERINWKKLAAVDIDRVIQHNDINVLRDNIKHIAFCELDAEMEIRASDRTLAKMFKMAQLMIDYLLNSQEHLAALAGEADERCGTLAEEAENSKRKVQENEAYINDLKRECHRRKKLILAQQQIMDSGPETYHRCPYCEKAFLNGSFLQAHLEKRHSERYIRSMHHAVERVRDESPRREHSRHDVHSSSERRIEELLRQFGEQKKESESKSDEFERMRRMMEDAMRQQRDEMEDVIHDLERRLQESQLRRENKPRSYIGDLEDDRDNGDGGMAHKEREEAVKKAIKDRQRQKKHMKHAESKTEQPVIVKRQPKQGNQGNQVYNASRSPRREQSPIQTRSPVRFGSPIRQRSPIGQRSSIERRSPELQKQSISLKGSVESLSRVSDVVDFDRMWEMNEQYRLQAREEVVKMLAEHLEHHGIKRTAPGIADSILKEKLNITDMEKRQLSIKYIDFAEIRQRLVVEVEAEANRKIHEKHNPLKHTVLPTRQIQEPVASAPSPKMRPLTFEPVKRDVELTSESDWDDNSPSDQRRNNIRQEKEALRKNKKEYEEELEDILRSPKRQSGQMNNARASSELSNTMNSSLWGPSESKAVTSVPHRSGPTNKSSDIGNQSGSFSES